MQLSIDFDSEKWIPIPGYEDIYKISDKGAIFNIQRNKLLSPTTAKSGYVIVGLSKDRKTTTLRLHRLVALSFMPCENSDTLQVNHKDGIKTNCKLSNLEWVTGKENFRHYLDFLYVRSDRLLYNIEYIKKNVNVLDFSEIAEHCGYKGTERVFQICKQENINIINVSPSRLNHNTLFNQ